MKWPEAFIQRMNKDLEYFNLDAKDFWQSFSCPTYKGIRFNSLKVETEAHQNLLQTLGQSHQPVPWSQDGYYVSSDLAWGKLPYYHAGLFYIQEPSAMLPAELLAAKPGEKILDLCSAPGGKATKIGADLQGQGLLVANEISFTRAKALQRNLELFGIDNVVLVNNSPESLSQVYQDFFDKILVDAPCSGEGMFRRDPGAVKSWEKYGPLHCETLQKSILQEAALMVKTGGTIVYSTCTFGRTENEDRIDWFLQEFPGFKVVPQVLPAGVVSTQGKTFSGGLRIWPHLAKGDGHFAVVLKKEEAISLSSLKESTVAISSSSNKNGLFHGKKHNSSQNLKNIGKNSKKAEETILKEAIKSFRLFLEDLGIFAGPDTSSSKKRSLFLEKQENVFKIHHSHLFYSEALKEMKEKMTGGEEPSSASVKILKQGILLGEIKQLEQKTIFIPAQSLAFFIPRLIPLTKINQANIWNLETSSIWMQRYLRGESLDVADWERCQKSSASSQAKSEGKVHSGYILMTVDNYPLGWCKIQQNQMKNLYPKAWRN